MSWFNWNLVLWRNWLTFSGAEVPDTDSESIFQCPHHCRIGDFRRFLSTSRTATTTAAFTKPGDMIDADMVVNPQYFGRDPADIRSELIWIRILDHLWLKLWHWRRFAVSEDSVVGVMCRYQVQILLRLEMEAVCSDSGDNSETSTKNGETLEEVFVIFH